MRIFEKSIKKVKTVIGSQMAINIRQRDLEVNIKSTLPYILLYRYKNQPQDELRGSLKASTSSLMIKNNNGNLEGIYRGYFQFDF